MKSFVRSVLVPVLVFASGWVLAQEQTASKAGNTKVIGAVTAVSGNNITLKSDAGNEVTVKVEDGARLLRSEPGQKSLKEASPIQLTDVQNGDRMLASGRSSDEGKTIAASTIVVMKQGDIASKQALEREAWQRHSVGGLVSAVDAATSTVKISTTALGQKKEITVQLSPTTIIRRYAPDSVKFDDARKSTLSEIKVGDQLRARGNRSADGSTVNAEEIVSGTFRNLAGTVQSVDAAKKQLTVMDLATKKAITVTVGPDSQMHKLPEMMAQRIALRLKGGAEASGQNGQDQGSAHQPSAGGASAGQEMHRGGAGSGGFGASGGGMRGGGGGDMMQLILNRAPVVQLTDLQKGDAVMLVATQGSEAAPPTAITLLAGVEPILSSNSDTSTILSPWNLGGGNGGADAGTTQ